MQFDNLGNKWMEKAERPDSLTINLVQEQSTDPSPSSRGGGNQSCQVMKPERVGRWKVQLGERKSGGGWSLPGTEFAEFHWS